MNDEFAEVGDAEGEFGDQVGVVEVEKARAELSRDGGGVGDGSARVETTIWRADNWIPELVGKGGRHPVVEEGRKSAVAPSREKEEVVVELGSGWRRGGRRRGV